MLDLTVRQKIAALVLLLFLVLGGGLLFIKGSVNHSQSFPNDTKAVTIYVDVCGAVVNPGVLILAPGTRKVDAIKRAGGALPGADLNTINLAAMAVDGEQIYVPRQGEFDSKSSKRSPAKPKPTKTPRLEPSKSPKPTKTPKTSPGLPENAPLSPAPTVGIITQTEYPLDLNTATQAQLDGVPGIGPVLAERIIKYREAHGGFRTYEELDKVAGIGQSRLEKLRSYLMVK